MSEDEQKQMECQYCDGHIQIITTKPSSKTNYKWIATNMDGTPHKHNRFSKPQENPPSKTTAITATTTNGEKKGWETAHEENMESQDRIIKALDNVSSKLEILKDLQHSIENLAASNTHLTAAAATLSENVKHFSLAIQEYLQVANTGNRS